jgi:intein/homing endonuclease
VKVHVYPGDQWGCGFHRMIWPAQQLIAEGRDISVIEQQKRRMMMDVDDQNHIVRDVVIPDDVDVIVFQRVTHHYLAQAVRVLRQKGVTVVIDVDDDLSTIHPTNPAWQELHPRLFMKPGRDGLPRMHSWANMEIACREASYITATTPALLRKYAPHGRGSVVANYLAPHYFDHKHFDSDVIGWPASLGSHPNDPDEVGNAIARLVDEGAHFHAMSTYPGVAKAFGIASEDKITSLHTAVALENWPRVLADQLGIGIAPLADTKFNAAKCLDAETQLTTRRGVIRLRTVIEGDEVWHDDAWHKVIALQTEVATPGLELTTRRGHKLRLTAEHRLRVNGQWQHANDLRVGDVLDMEPESWGDCDYVSLPWPADSRKTRNHTAFDRRAFWRQTNGPSVEINEAWGRLLGLIIGDGNIAHSGDVTIACNTDDADLVELITDDLQSMGFNVGITHKGKCTAVRVSSATLVRFLELIGAASQRENGMYTKVFDIPDIIWRSPRSVAIAFLAGLFEADGTGTSSVSLCTKSETLARSTQRLLTALGIISHVRQRDVKLSYVKKDGSRDYTSWNVVVLTRQLDVIRDDIMISARKRERLLASVTRRTAPGSHGHGDIESWNDEIVSIESVWVQPIDIQVEGEVLAVNGIVSHNSWLKPLELSAAGVPWVASPREDYVRLHKLGAGWLADKPSDWYKKLRALRGSATLRADLAGKGREVAETLKIENHAWRWWEAWREAVTSDMSYGSRPVAIL